MENNKVFARIYKEIVRNKGLLPGLPGLALKLRETVANPRHTLDDLARVVQTDPGATAYLLQIANSALYATRLPAQDIKSAIRRFGMPVTRNLIMAYSARQLFSSQSEAIEQAMAGVWKLSVRRSAIAAMLAGHCAVDADQALLAALLQDVGSLPVITYLSSQSRQLPPPQVLLKFLHALTPRVSALLMQRWELSDVFVEVALKRNHWSRRHEGPTDLVDVVLVARLLSLKGTHHLPEWPGPESAPALKRFGQQGLDEAAAEQLLQQAEREIEEIQALLQ